MSSRQLVFAGMASFGNRRETLRRAVDSLIDQVDRLGVYLNNYDEIPAFLDHPRIEVAVSADHGDVRDNGKFFFLDRAKRYYAAVDDDIEYPADYIERLLTELEHAGPGAAMGVHGAIYPTRILGLSKPRKLFHYLEPLRFVMPVHLIGTGTLLFNQADWRLSFEEFEEPGMADVWFAISARRRDARLFVVNRNKQWLRDVPAEVVDESAAGNLRLFAEARVDDSRQVGLLSSARVSQGGIDRLLGSLIESTQFAENLTISQAVMLDEVRRELGWSSISHTAANEARNRISSCRQNWSADDYATTQELDSYTNAAIGLLAGDLSAAVTIETLQLLERTANLAHREADTWKSLPYPLRFDTGRRRLQGLRTPLVDRSFRRSAEDARALWSRQDLIGRVDLDLVIEAERAGVTTSFQRLPQLKNAARTNWKKAASSLRSLFEAREFAEPPALGSWRQAFGETFYEIELQLLLCWISIQTKEVELATSMLNHLRLTWPSEFDVHMMEAAFARSLTEDSTAPLTATLRPLDALLRRLDLNPFETYVARDPGRQDAHWLTRLAAQLDHPVAHAGDHPTVSVILTAYNSASTLAAAMASVLSSEDVDLQLIVVDDHSTDDTADVARALGDDRVTVLRNRQNLGPYVSRNRGLTVAEGDFVTIADADDWTHPERIRFQVERMREEPQLWACTVAHLRLLPDGSPDLENNLRFLGHGPVSLLFRRSLVDHIGGFDHVRTRGDIEFIRRLRSRFGSGSIGSYQVPLILASSSGTSNSRRHPDELLDRYRRAAREWHIDNALTDALYVSLTSDERAGFVAPSELLVSPPFD